MTLRHAQGADWSFDKLRGRVGLSSRMVPAEETNSSRHPLRYTFDPLMLLGATANITMQLALKPVGYGVAESTVDSGNTFKHPIKRLRTTLSYLAVATLGTEGDRLHYREAVDTSHRQVVSAPGARVKYNAFSTDLQLWVAACLYMGFVWGHEALHGPIPDDVADDIYPAAATLGTTLQMPADMWPADREAFAAYWDEGLARCEIDDVVAAYLWSLIDLKNLPRWMRWPFVSMSRFFTIGFLPQVLRTQLAMTWSERQQRRFDRSFRVAGRFTRFLPRFAREFPYNVLLLDVRRRIRTGRPLV